VADPHEEGRFITRFGGLFIEMITLKSECDDQESPGVVIALRLVWVIRYHRLLSDDFSPYQNKTCPQGDCSTCILWEQTMEQTRTHG